MNPEPSASLTLTPGWSQHELKVENVSRKFWLQVPEGCSASPPLLLLLHGRTGNGKQVAAYTGFAQKAETEKFIAVYPEALGNPTAWNARYNSGVGNGDDLSFLEQLVRLCCDQLPVDSGRMFMAGHSSGAMMTFYFGAAFPKLLAGVAVVAGSVGGQRPGESLLTIPIPAFPIPVLMIHGAKDTVVPYGEELRNVAKFKHFLPVAESVRFWITHNQCHTTPIHRVSGDGLVAEHEYRGTNARAQVILCTLVNGNHHWPGGSPMAETGSIQPNTELNATDRIWDFFMGATH